jgi:alpha-galactosidase
LLQRNQAVLDLTDPAVATHIYDRIDELLGRNQISYLKWDMNRDLTGVSRDELTDHDRHVRAVYQLVDRLRASHSQVEIESCASGGGRCDWGMLERADRVWVSDSNDALDRFDIQRNANLFLPPEVCGIHVGPAACHITGRRLGLDLRAHVATFGHLGLELDLRALSDTDTERLSSHIANYKRFRPLMHTGLYWRLAFDDTDHSGVCVTSADKKEALVLILRSGSKDLGRGTVLLVPGLKDEYAYQVEAVTPLPASVEQSLAASFRSGRFLQSGKVLSGKGLDLFLPRPESSLLLHFNAS